MSIERPKCVNDTVSDVGFKYALFLRCDDLSVSICHSDITIWTTSCSRAGYIDDSVKLRLCPPTIIMRHSMFSCMHIMCRDMINKYRELTTRHLYSIKQTRRILIKTSSERKYHNLIIEPTVDLDLVQHTCDYNSAWYECSTRVAAA